MKNTTEAITVETTVHSSIEEVWKIWTTASHIMNWNNPSDDWHSPNSFIDLKEGGHFSFRMEAKDGSVGFDHKGVYDKVKVRELIEYTVADGRKSVIQFIPNGNETRIIETFEPEPETPIDMQRDFCQAVLNNFKQYAEQQIS